MSALPTAPSDLVPRGRGRKFWKLVHEDHELRADESELLAECCRMMDLLDALREVADPPVVDGRVNPALVEARQTRESLRKTLAVLNFPGVDEAADGPVPPEVADLRSRQARKAARARWDRQVG